MKNNLFHAILALVVLAGIWYLVSEEITLYFVCTIIAVSALIISAIREVPTAHYAVETIFGMRTGRTFKEGLCLTVPFIGKFLLYPATLSTYSLEESNAATAVSADNMEIKMEGSVQLRPDFNKLLKFVEITEETIQKGMRDAIESGLGIIAGSEKGEDFITRRKAIEYIINCTFLLERRPDYYVNEPEKFNSNPPKSFTNYLKRLRKVNEGNTEKLERISHLEAKEWEIPVKDNMLDVLSFYEKNVRRIETMLQLEGSMNESSKEEELYAIDIATFKLSKVTFSKKTMESLEKNKQAEKELEATKRRQEEKMAIMGQLIDKGVNPDQASNDADAAVGIAPKQTIAGGVIPLVNLGIGGK